MLFYYWVGGSERSTGTGPELKKKKEGLDQYMKNGDDNFYITGIIDPSFKT